MNEPHDLVKQPPPAIQRVEVEGRVYEIIQVHPQPIAPQYQQSQYIQPYQAQRPSLWDDPRTIIFAGIGCIFLGGGLTWLVVKAFAPEPTPTQLGPTLLVPPPPQPKPYTREECRPAGLFGWGQDCYRERGYQ